MPDYCPTPEEIAAACRQIQSEWSEGERLRRGASQSGFARLRARLTDGVMPHNESITHPKGRVAAAAGRHSRS
jgi:hypothetical protein